MSRPLHEPGDRLSSEVVGVCFDCDAPLRADEVIGFDPRDGRLWCSVCAVDGLPDPSPEDDLRARIFGALTDYETGRPRRRR